MRKFVMMIMVVALTALPAMAQVFGQQQSQQFGAQAPNAQIQSTSTFSGSGSSYSSNPTLNSDGTATFNGAASSSAKLPGGPRRVIEDESDPGPLDPGSPVGSPVLPLLLLACAYMCLRPFLKRKRATQS